MPRVVKRSAPQAVKSGPSRRGQSGSDSPLPRFIAPQLSQPVEKPPSGPRWLYQIKLDGYRMAARIDNGRVQLLTRTGLDWTHKYPRAIAALANLNVKTAYIDDELRGVDEAGLLGFALTQAATHGKREALLVYYGFDLLHLDRRDVSALPLIERKALLEPLIANKPGLQYNGHDTGDGELILKHAGSSASRASFPRRATRLMRLETAAYGAKPRRSTAKSSSFSAGLTRKDLVPISGRCCSATSQTTANSSMPAAWVRECL
jgi:ATP-dependent DNA ligase